MTLPNEIWHAGEVALQQRIGVAERMRKFGSQVIKPFMPEQHQQFYAQLPFIVVGAVDEAGLPWASVWEGEAGFIRAISPIVLTVRTSVADHDPLHTGIAQGKSIGLLGIQLHTRRRNRLNGVIRYKDENQLSVAVQQSFGNCPQYIQTRYISDAENVIEPDTPQVEALDSLDEAASTLITQADTFFVASYVDIPSSHDGVGESMERQVDVSHRGGQAGFVRVKGNRLSIPDFSGNRYFNTLGNLVLNPKAGLLFIDFTTGDVLQLTGTTEIVHDGAEVVGFQGAERIWHVNVQKMVRRRGLLKLRWDFGTFSPNSLWAGS